MELFRDQAILLSALFTSDLPVAGQTLSRQTDIGIKTLKKEIDNLNAICADKGFEIISKSGSGYEVQVNQAEIFNVFREEFLHDYHRNLFFRSSEVDRRHYVIRMILSTDRIYISNLADLCHCSVSTMNRTLRDVQSYMERYQLKLTNHTNNGMSLEGSEWCKRMALVMEYQVYTDYPARAEWPQEKKFEDIFIISGSYRNIISNIIKKVLLDNSYSITYEAIVKLANMVILTITRRKYASLLDESLAWFRETDCPTECDIVDQIMNQLPAPAHICLRDAEKMSLALILKASKVLYYHEFLALPDHEKTEKLARGFILYLNSRVSLEGLSTDLLYKDLCTTLYGLTLRAKYGISNSSSSSASYKHDGLRSLDCCALLYLYLQSQHINCAKNDVLICFPIFSYLNKELNQIAKKRILLVSRQGFFYARNLAYLYAERCAYNIEFIPAEYLSIQKFNLQEFDAIATDIEDVKWLYPHMKVIDLYYIHQTKKLNQLARMLVTDKDRIMAEFHQTDLLYVDSLKDMSDIEAYIVDKVLTKNDPAAKLIAGIRERNSVFAPNRKNQCMILNGFGDCLGRDLFKIILLEKPFKIDDNNITTIILYNVGQASFINSSPLHYYVAAIMHADAFVPTMDRQKDYESLVNIIHEGA